MADYHAIAAVSRALLSVLEGACPRADLGAVNFKLYRVSDFQEPMKEGISLYLFRLTTSARRNLPPRTDALGRTRRPPLPLDLYYLLTAWAESAEKQQHLLGWAISELNDNALLPAALLNDYYQPPNGSVFHDDEDVTVTFEPLSLQDLANLWEPLKPGLQASACYVARMVALESRLFVPDAQPVQTRQFDFLKGGRR